MKNLARLFAFYFSQGLPFGFQATALPLLLRERGVSLATIGFASMLAVPWLAKALWAPLVDRYGSTRFGRRKSWIVPMQAALTLTALAASTVGDDLRTLCALVLLMNLFAATQDIAVDALAVSWLERDQVGPGNALQVVGYKLGMLTSGGLLVAASERLGWAGQFRLMALLMALVLVIALFMREPPVVAHTPEQSEPPSFGEIATRVRSALAEPGTLALIAVVLTYKTGESLADGMWKPLLVDRGFRVAEIGLWNGSYGMVCSLVGSSLAGLYARRVPLERALLVTAILRALGVAGEWWISATPAPTAAAVVAVTCVEHLVGGAITTVLFALMMRHTDRAIGATHYTLLASLEVWGKQPLGTLSGVVATALGYEGLFALGTLLCLAFAVLVRALRARLALAAASTPEGALDRTTDSG